MEKIKIIIAEDDIDEIKFLKEGFEESGLFEIIDTVENGVVLLNNIKNGLYLNKADAILTDLNLPLKGGFDILEEMSSSTDIPKIPIFIFSNSATPAIIEKCMNLGAKKYFIKPFSFLDYNLFAKELYDFYKQS
jgi:CheY-like chemotaxis protein